MKKFLHSRFFKFILSVGIALLIFFICPPCYSKLWLGLVLLLLLVFINGSHIFARFAWLTHFCRIVVGGLFIFSGWIKANDTVGFGYKLEEYFEVFKEATGWGLFDAFAEIAQPIATIICVSEMVLGFLLLIGLWRNLTLWLLMLQIVFFTFLTFYSACYNKVTTCGCFGDFLVLKPWTSFVKDLVLLILITVLFVGKENINPLFNRNGINIALAALFTIYSIWFPVYTFRNLPVKDFRAYAPGKSICEGLKPGPNFKPAVYESRFLYRNLKTGEKKEFTDKNMPWQDTLTWAYDSALGSVELSPAVDAPKIVDFTLADLDGNNITDSILGIKGYNFYIIYWNLEKASDDPSLHARINDFYELARKNKIPVTAITASSSDQINDFKHKHNALYDFASADGVVLKTMIRSNPGLMLVKDCRVVANWHYNNWPSFSQTKEEYMK
jgi:uncharacterized membrane protein YphA (DoxX/SURF4 family)